MELLLQREPSNDVCTMGKLYIDGEYFCETIEDPVRPKKIKHITAIPAGRYQIRITHSPRFKRPLPPLLNVPNYEGVRIHSGNFAEDSSGCVILGLERASNSVLKSRVAVSKLITKIARAADANQLVWITIKNAPTVRGS